MAKLLKSLLRFRTLVAFFTILGMLALGLAYLGVFLHPKTSKIAPLFGLLYWIILLCNGILLITWLFLKDKRWWIAIAVLIVVGGSLHFRTFCFGSDDENSANNTELKVLSYNVRLFDLYNPRPGENIKTKRKIFDFLLENTSDVYCFQEFYHGAAPSRFQTKDSLRSILGSSFTHSRFTFTTVKQEFGIMMYSRHPIIQKGEVSFSDIQKTNNYCIYADIVKETDTFRVYNVHLQSIQFQQDDYALFNEDNAQAAEENSRAFKLLRKIVKAYPVRAEQVQKVVDHMEQSPHPVIVCGDFNDPPMSYSYTLFNRTLTDAFRNTSKGMGATYAGKVPAGRIDYIFHDPSLGSKDFKIQEEELSDHYAISCTLFKKE